MGWGEIFSSDFLLVCKNGLFHEFSILFLKTQKKETNKNMQTKNSLSQHLSVCSGGGGGTGYRLANDRVILGTAADLFSNFF